MARPQVLFATISDEVNLDSIKADIGPICDVWGLKFKATKFDSAENLFEELESGSPVSLADTLVLLHVGRQLSQAFACSIRGQSGWHQSHLARAGIAMELVLRFPQVFPLILYDDAGTLESVENDLIVKHRLANRGAGNDVESLRKAPFTLGFHFLHIANLDSLTPVLSRFASGMRCWFDPTGLRTLVRNKFLGTIFGSDADWQNTKRQREVLLGRLDNMAVALDEEREFAMFSAYAAYKWGRRAWMVTTFHEFNLSAHWADMHETAHDVVVLRDIDLRFPDIPDVSDARVADGSTIRAALCSVESDLWKYLDSNKKKRRLAPEWRVRAVSSAQSVKTDFPFGFCNEQQAIRGEWRSQFVGLTKPIGSLYKLKEFLEPPTGSVISKIGIATDASGETHGAPYLNLAIAESMLVAGKRCQDGPVENLIGALLASEAYELLLGMSLTTALEALLAMHKHEVAAEVEFPGISHAIEVGQRKADIEASVATLCSNRSAAMKNMYLSRYWAELKQIYRQGEQFSAAEDANFESLIRGRWLSWAPPLKRTLIWIATSPTGLLSAIAGTIILAAMGYALADAQKISWPQLLRDSFLTSVTMQPMGEMERLIKGGWASWGSIVGVFHLSFSYVFFGLAVAMLYRKITRS